MNTGDMEKYCPKPHPVYFNAFSMWQQLSGSVQYLINTFTSHTQENTKLHMHKQQIMCTNTHNNSTKIPITDMNTYYICKDLSCYCIIVSNTL